MVTSYEAEAEAWLRDRVESKRVKELEALLKAAKCPNCDGSGVVQIEVPIHQCCNQPWPSGECCGEVEQCQWCAEREALIGDKK